MEHIAIMKKSWGLTEKILTGEKTVDQGGINQNMLLGIK